MKSLIPILLILATTLSATPPADRPTDDLPNREYGYELFRYLYRWHLDAAQFAAEHGRLIDGDIEVWLRHLHYESDPDDRSVYVEVLIPQIRTEIILKKADYSIPELGVAVKNRDFRIATLSLYETPSAPEDAYQKTIYQGQEIFENLYQSRNQKVFLDRETRQRMGHTLWEQMQKEGGVEIKGDQLIFLAPLSPVTNDVWIFWENQRKIVRFSSDADYESAFYWKHQDIGVDIIDLDENIVVSLSEKPGSNAYVTKDRVGRILFNCIVLGMKIVIPEDEVEAETEETGS